MSYEDLVTIKKFLTALENLEQPLPEDIRINLSTIAENLRESACTLQDGHDSTSGVLSPQPSQVNTIKNIIPSPRLIQELGWTQEDAAAIRYRLAAFRDDWEAPGMEIYDDL